MMLGSKVFDPLIPTDFSAFHAHEILKNNVTIQLITIILFSNQKLWSFMTAAFLMEGVESILFMQKTFEKFFKIFSNILLLSWIYYMKRKKTKEFCIHFLSWVLSIHKHIYQLNHQITNHG